MNTNNNKKISVIGLLILLLVLPGCALLEIRNQAKVVENAGEIEGTVKVDSGQQGLVKVLRYRLIKGVFTLESLTTASAQGEYRFRVLPDDYYIAAFIDADNNGQYDPGEHANYYGLPTPITVNPRQLVRVDTLTISGPPPTLNTDMKTENKIKMIYNNIGHVVSLSDPMFLRENYSMGMWRPFDFIEQIGGGLFFLQEYDAGKIPVLFVHGMNGGPTDWLSAIEGIDKQRFQPWIFYYPSGFRLDLVSDYLVHALAEIQTRYAFKQLNIAAHSMGGLVARSFVQKYWKQFPDQAKNIHLMLTVNSPMNGMPSAASGVNHSPIVVPSWRDVATNSQFIMDLQAWRWPKDIPYHLIFSYKTGESDDGVVPLQSQLPPKLQAEAVRMYAFNNDHAGTLTDQSFLALFNEILANSN